VTRRRVSEYDRQMATIKKKPAKKAAPKKKLAPKKQPKVVKKVDERASDITYYRDLLSKAREGLVAAENQVLASRALVHTYEQRLDELQGHH